MSGSCQERICAPHSPDEYNCFVQWIEARPQTRERWEALLALEPLEGEGCRWFLCAPKQRDPEVGVT